MSVTIVMAFVSCGILTTPVDCRWFVDGVFGIPYFVVVPAVIVFAGICGACSMGRDYDRDR
jgi:hypothetical protein